MRKDSVPETDSRSSSSISAASARTPPPLISSDQPLGVSTSRVNNHSASVSGSFRERSTTVVAPRRRHRFSLRRFFAQLRLPCRPRLLRGPSKPVGGPSATSVSRATGVSSTSLAVSRRHHASGQSTQSNVSIAAGGAAPRASTSSTAGHSSGPQLRAADSSLSYSSVSSAGVESVGGVGVGGGAAQSLSECPLCMTSQPLSNFPVLQSCAHRSCVDCLRRYLQVEISESRVAIACPECDEPFHPNDIASVLNNRRLLLKYEEFMLRRVLVSDPDTRWCPAPDCSYAVIATGCASCPKLHCGRSGCLTQFCYHCKQYWHPNQTCDAARAERSSQFRSSISYSHDSSAHSEIKPCPRCGAFIIKMDDGSCNHITCSVCGSEFCWLCMKEISDLHYLSPSGCTFWGKKPWSRKKKILWQLGTLVGAPVGIGLIAGIAIPAMIIGIPVWVGRKLHVRYQFASRHRRNLVMTGGITASILLSPIIASLAVGIGVPILLAYVYGVVPISLCRSGGCGVSAGNSGGVRFEFDDDADISNAASASLATAGGGPSQHGSAPDGPGAGRTSGGATAEPSLAPSIGEASVQWLASLSASGAHLERAGLAGARGCCLDDADRDSVSTRAIAGASLSGSLSGSAIAGHHGFNHKLEVQADVASCHSGGGGVGGAIAGGSSAIRKRDSLSGESANFSLDAKSATVSFSDDVSTRALTGSLCTRDRDNNSAVVPPMDATSDAASRSSVEPVSMATSGRQAHGSPTSTRSVNFSCDPEIIDDLVGAAAYLYTAPGGAGMGRRYGSGRRAQPRGVNGVSASIDENLGAGDTSPAADTVEEGVVSSYGDAVPCGSGGVCRRGMSLDSVVDSPRHAATGNMLTGSSGGVHSGDVTDPMTEVEPDKPSRLSHLSASEHLATTHGDDVRVGVKTGGAARGEAPTASLSHGHLPRVRHVWGLRKAQHTRLDESV